MNLLLDTHVLIWWLADPSRLSLRAQEAIGDGGNIVFVSAVSVWEMAIKAALGKLRRPDDLDAQMKRERFQELPLRHAHAHAVAQLRMLHRDPFDRMLIAQARAESLTLVTDDATVLGYGGQMLRA